MAEVMVAGSGLIVLGKLAIMDGDCLDVCRQLEWMRFKSLEMSSRGK